jgi:hypothetical protein
MNTLLEARVRLLGVAFFLALILLGFDRYGAYAHRAGPESTRVVI